MRAAAVSCALVLAIAGCSKKKDAPGSAAPTGNDAGAQNPHPHGTSAMQRGLPPQKFVDADTTGRILAHDATHVYWADRKADGNFLVRGAKAGGARETIAGPISTVTAMAIGGESLYFSTAVSPGKAGEKLPTGVFRVAKSGGEVVKLLDDSATLSATSSTMVALFRGHRKAPGQIVTVDATGKATTVFQAEAGLGRAAVAATEDAIYWLSDRREKRNGVTVRLGTVSALLSGQTTPVVLTEDIVGPGPYLKAHGGYVYLTGKDSQERRRLYKIPAAGGDPEPVGEPMWEVNRFAVDDSGVYVYANRKGWKIARLTGKPTVLSSIKIRMASDLLIDETHLYWGDSGTILRASKVLTKVPAKNESK